MSKEDEEQFESIIETNEISVYDDYSDSFNQIFSAKKWFEEDPEEFYDNDRDYDYPIDIN
jgi:hypothetical protein